MQKIVMMGRLVRDAVIREGNGKNFVSFTVAINSKSRGVEKTSYYDVLWNNYYDKMVQYLTKGSAVSVIGDLDAGTEVSSKNGQTYLRLNVFADSVQFTGLSSSGTTGTVAESKATPVATPVATTYAQPINTVTAPAPAAPVAAQSPAPVMAVPSFSGNAPEDDLPF